MTACRCSGFLRYHTISSHAIDNIRLTRNKMSKYIDIFNSMWRVFFLPVVRCPPPPNWLHASLFPDLTLWEYGQVMNITCEPGYWVSKYVYATWITCTEYGTWQPPSPSENQCQCKLNMAFQYHMHGPLTIYAKLRVTHAPGMPQTLCRPPTSKEPANIISVNNSCCDVLILGLSIQIMEVYL